jgi:TM2 domain-containing membrane protein YozV/uncharacterized Zn finger protein (UPF0148 family)
MLVQSATCTSCGAPVKISSDTDIIDCAFCGVSLEVQRGEGIISLKLIEKFSKTMEDIGVQTQSSIKESTRTTQIELQRIQLSQQLTAAQIQLASIRSEIRALERHKKDRRIKKQLKELYEQEIDLNSQIKSLISAQNNLTRVFDVKKSDDQYKIFASSKSWSIAMILAIIFGYFGFHRFYSGHWKIGIVQLLTLGGVGIWWIIDIFMIATNRYKDSRGFPLLNYNNKLGKSIVNGTIIFVVLFIIGTVIGFSPDIGIVISCICSLIVLGATFFMLTKKEKSISVMERPL